MLSSKEEKLFLWEVVIIFIYYFSNNLKSCEVNFGIISLSENTDLLKLMPIVFGTVMFFLQSVTLQKLELTKTIDLLSVERFAKKIPNGDTRNFIVKIINPFNLSNSLANMINEDSNRIEIAFNFLIIIPLLIIGLTPYYILIQMLIDLYNNHSVDFIGRISFWLTILLSIMVAFYYISGTVRTLKQSIK
ncbi:hypothetical protein SAMN02927903_03412 [Flavobacterium caeni]|uniref:Uncharacterized protein n=2 Tax=Flavobacterium caeni TaxID=490189 RepID=A0A1G5KPU9_9FLAO|nr:hypothetical protein SAMN02927903_03412 [Flavobacterium caeni]